MLSCVRILSGFLMQISSNLNLFSLKFLLKFLKTFNFQLPVAYWARVYSLQLGIKAAKQPDEKAFLLTLMDWLESVKKSNKENESITSETVGQAHLENYAHKLFTYADQQDRASNFGKNVVKAFYTSAMVSRFLLQQQNHQNFVFTSSTTLSQPSVISQKKLHNAKSTQSGRLLTSTTV